MMKALMLTLLSMMMTQAGENNMRIISPLQRLASRYNWLVGFIIKPLRLPHVHEDMYGIEYSPQTIRRLDIANRAIDRLRDSIKEDWLRTRRELIKEDLDRKIKAAAKESANS